MAHVEVRSVSKTFDRSANRVLLRSFIKRLARNGNDQRLVALRDVSFSVAAGEGLAVVGRNGSGKSTLLAIIAGIFRPDAGTVESKGRIAALLNLGAGFHPDLTGAENLLVNAALLGLRRRDVEQRYEHIVQFSGLGRFIHEPLRTYSSGMCMRLAFSVAIHAVPDIMLVDEVLAVGDAAFQRKCIDAILQLRESGKVFICVSHSLGILRELCHKAVWLEQGAVAQKGDIDDVLRAYTRASGTVEIRPQ